MKTKMLGFVALTFLMAWNYWAVIFGLLSIVALDGCVRYVVSLLHKLGKGVIQHLAARN